MGRERVFPTQVGMFLRPVVRIELVGGFPHAGGDVSFSVNVVFEPSKFSPRRWGCFQGDGPAFDRPEVFPTQVGMFLPSPRLVRTLGVFPTQVGMFLRP